MTTDKKKAGAIQATSGTTSEKTSQGSLRESKEENEKNSTPPEDTRGAIGEGIAKLLPGNCRYVKHIADYSYSPELLKMVSADLAMRYLLFPLKRENNMLCLAMADLGNMDIVSTLAGSKGLVAIPFIAAEDDIIAAINKHYRGNGNQFEN